MRVLIGSVLRAAWRDTRRQPWAFLAGVVVLMIMGVLVGTGMLVNRAVSNGVARWAGGATVEVFLHVDTPDPAVQRFQAWVSGLPGVRRVEFLDRSDAAREVRKVLQDRLAEYVRPSDLPVSFRLHPRRAEDTLRLARQVRQHPDVLRVLSADDEVRRLIRTSRVFRDVARLLGLVLATAAFGLFWLQTRATIAARRRELYIMSLVGASRSVIAAPLLLSLLGQAVLACIGTGLVLRRAAVVIPDMLPRTGHWLASFRLSLADTVHVTGFTTALLLLVTILGAGWGVWRGFRASQR